jgi:phage tail sheath protein FI
MSYNSPGIYFEEQEFTNGPTLVAPQNIYMFGTAGTGGSAESNVFEEVRTVSEFTEKFGANSPSLVYVNMFFGQLLSAPLNFLAVEYAETKPSPAEFSEAVSQIDETFALGVLLAPEFFDKDSTNAVAFANTLGAKAAELNHVAIIDPPSTAKASIGTPSTAGSVLKFAADITSRSHSALYFPYLTISDGAGGEMDVPPSCAVCAVYVRAAIQDGIAQPPAGQRYPLYSVLGTSLKVNKAERDVLNPKGVNAISQIRRLGWLVYGARTLDTNDMTYVNSRVILNVETVLLREALGQMLFTPYDNKGTVFQRAKEVCDAVMWQLWNAGALAGDSPARAYLIECDSTNNPPESLARGELTVTVKQVLAGTIEVIAVRPLRVTAALLNQTTIDKTGNAEDLAAQVETIQ